MPKIPEKNEARFVKEFFKKNPKETKLRRKDFPEQLTYSYLKTREGIIRLSSKEDQERLYAHGGFGKVKSSENMNKKINTVIKIQTLSDKKHYEDASREAIINLDLGVATTELVFVDNGEDKPAQMYQEMYRLGKPINEVIVAHTEMKQRLDYAIKLLIKVDEMHTGKASKSGKKYAHRDIKPQNVLIDTRGDLHLIDFSFSSDINEFNRDCEGSNGYLPIDKIHYDKGTVTPLSMHNVLKKNIIQTVNVLIDDKIATLRTIFNPIEDFPGSIFCKEDFTALPECIQELFDTTTIAPHLTPARQNDSEHFFAAVLIYYQQHQAINQAKIDELRGNKVEQIQLIQRYQRQNAILALDSDVANRLLEKIESHLNDYHDYLEKKYPLIHDELEIEPLELQKYKAIKTMLNIKDNNKSPQFKLAELESQLARNYSLLSQARKPDENDFWRAIKFWFTDLLGIVKGRSLVFGLEKRIDNVLAESSTKDFSREVEENTQGVHEIAPGKTDKSDDDEIIHTTDTNPYPSM